MHVVPPFEPVRWLPGGDLQTIVPSFAPARAPSGDAWPLTVTVAPGSAVRVLVNRPASSPRGTMLLIHGMVGSAESPYVRRAARVALARRWVTARMNLRNCGGTEALSSTLYNAGQSDDAARVLEALDAASLPRPFVAAGFSLGGNLLLRHAGIAGTACLADAVAGINPPVDLAACLRALERPRNSAYQLYFSMGLCAQVRAVRRVRPHPGPDASARTIRTVRRFDTLFTAPDAGFRSAEDYYEASSAGPTLSGLRVPALILSAANDPFVPPAMFEPHAGSRGSPLRVAIAAAGGHCGFWSSGPVRFWAGEALTAFFEDSVTKGGRLG